MATKFLGAQKRAVKPGGFVPSRRNHKKALRSWEVGEAASKFLTNRGIWHPSFVNDADLERRMKRQQQLMKESL